MPRSNTENMLVPYRRPSAPMAIVLRELILRVRHESGLGELYRAVSPHVVSTTVTLPSEWRELTPAAQRLVVYAVPSDTLTSDQPFQQITTDADVTPFSSATGVSFLRPPTSEYTVLLQEISQIHACSDSTHRLSTIENVLRKLDKILPMATDNQQHYDALQAACNALGYDENETLGQANKEIICQISGTLMTDPQLLLPLDAQKPLSTFTYNKSVTDQILNNSSLTCYMQDPITKASVKGQRPDPSVYRAVGSYLENATLKLRATLAKEQQAITSKKSSLGLSRQCMAFGIFSVASAAVAITVATTQPADTNIQQFNLF